MTKERKKVYKQSLDTNLLAGFSMVEIVVIIAIMVVLLAILTPSILTYVENSRLQKDESTMDELINAVQLSLTDINTFDEVFSYAIPNNYLTYTDSSGLYGTRIKDSEYWAPDGAGSAVTITFNPVNNGHYVIGNGYVNDMTYGNGSVAQQRTADGELKQCYFSEMGTDRHLLYSGVKQSIGESVINTSATYRNSSYTVFIKFSVKDGTRAVDVYGSFNGTNLDNDSQASIGSGTDSYDNNDVPQPTKTGGTQQTNFTQSDLSGGGSIATNTPSYQPAPPPIHNDIIPAGGIYYVGVTNEKLGNYTGATATYTAGDPFPETVKKGDVYVYGDYEYRYGKEYFTKWQIPSGTPQMGWGVKVLDNSKTNYGAILLTIANSNIVNLSYTFENCKMLIVPPEIPETVTSLGATFRGCSALTTAPTLPNRATISSIFSGCVSLKTYVGSTDPDGDFSNYKLPTRSLWTYSIFSNCQQMTKPPKLPSGVYGLSYAFSNCTSLTDLSDMEIPQGVTEINGMFSGCTALEVAPNLPSKITKMAGAFSNCKKLKTYAGSTSPDGDFSNYKIPDNVTTFDSAFEGCESLRIAPIIPNKVQSMVSAFSQCTSLTQAPIIPDSVTRMNGAFSGCTTLTDLSHIEIPGSVTRLEWAFQNCTSLTKAPDLTNASSLQSMYNTFENCSALTTIKIIPSTVTDMRGTFLRCPSLTGTIIIKGNPQYNSNCFSGTVLPIQITGDSPILNEIAASYNNVTVG